MQACSLAIKAFCIASSPNSKVDALSRQQSSPQELAVSPFLFQALTSWRGPLQVDLMASAENAQLPHFFSQLPDKRALGCNALAQNWSQWKQIYIFPLYD